MDINPGQDRRCLRINSQLKSVDANTTSDHSHLTPLREIRVPSVTKPERNARKEFNGILRHPLLTDICDRNTTRVHGLSGPRAQSCPPQVYLCLDRLLEYLIGHGILVLPLVIIIDEEF